MTVLSLDDFSLPLSQNDGPDVSVIQHQKSQRLRVNRVAIIQELNVAHVLPHLIKSGVISDDDRKTVVSARTTHNKTRRLLDLLPQKGRGVDWYGVFREALICPNTYSADTRKKYQILVAFLDNTIIPTLQTPREVKRDPGVESRFPHLACSTEKTDKTQSGSYVSFQSHQNLYTNGKMSTSKDTDASTKSASSTVADIKNFATIIREPHEHFKSLETSGEPEDVIQLEREKDVLRKVRKLEVVYVLDRRGQLGAELCLSKAMDDVLADPDTFHLYYKYFQTVQRTYDITMMADIGGSFVRFLESLKDSSNDDLRERIVGSTFRMFQFMRDFGLYDQSEVLLFALARYLSTHQCVETRVAMWQTYVKMMQLNNINVKHHEANQSRNMAKKIGHQIRGASSVQLDESELLRERSVLLRERGSVLQAVPLAERALEVGPSFLSFSFLSNRGYSQFIFTCERGSSVVECWTHN